MDRGARIAHGTLVARASGWATLGRADRKHCDGGAGQKSLQGWTHPKGGKGDWKCFQAMSAPCMHMCTHEHTSVGTHVCTQVCTHIHAPYNGLDSATPPPGVCVAQFCAEDAQSFLCLVFSLVSVGDWPLWSGSTPGGGVTGWPKQKVTDWCLARQK